MHDDADRESPAEEMVRELHLDPALGERIEDDPLLKHIREENAEQ